MDKSTVEKFKKEERPVWFLGRRTAMPIKSKIVSICDDDSAGEYAKLEYICDDDSAGEYAKLEYICDDECAVLKSADVSYESIYESKDDLVADLCKEALKEAAEIKAAVQTKDDCIRFMFSHTVSCAGEYTDLVARRTIQNIARKRWGIDLK